MDSLQFNDPLLVRLLGATSQRGSVISNNLANANTPGFTPERVEFESRLRAALERGDSLDTVELVMELEEEFDVNIPDDAAEKIQTVGQAVDFIDQNANNS